MSETDRWKHRDAADERISMDVSVHGVRADDVEAVPIKSFPGEAAVRLGGSRVRIELAGPIAELRAIAVEIDRQLALLEVEHRVDETVAEDAADDGLAG